MTKTGKKINGKQKLTPSDIVVHIILVILSVIQTDPDSVDRSDQLPWRKRTVCFYIAAKGVYSWQLHKVIYRYRYPEFSEDVHEYFDYCDFLLYNIYSICIGDVILYVENAFPTETPIYECSIDPWYVPGIHGYDRSLLYLKGDRTVRRILDPCCTYPGLFRWCRLTVLYCKRLL